VRLTNEALLLLYVVCDIRQCELHFCRFVKEVALSCVFLGG
jgi:hypothetical protein